MVVSKTNNGKRPIQLITHENPQSPITEQYRQIRNNIRFASVDKEIKTIVVTSPEPSDGKSTTAANLAIILAQQEKRVILVDADLRRPSIHYAFSVSNLGGLTSVLTWQKSLKTEITTTQVPNLDILTCGPVPPNPSELLNSKAMERVIEELKESYEYVVFDTPPILAVTDSQIMANKCDGVVLVVCSRKTKNYKGLYAKELLEKANSHLLGVVVNGVKVKRNWYYGQYY
ncbi:capsular biosynthesis protein [Bacillus sp. AFS006103]|jgi:capsular exopolysaccharide synthesis family protein|nr:capsular biosynthesis protein [Bacillus sp. AFS006103]